MLCNTYQMIFTQ